MLQYFLCKYKSENGDQSPPRWEQKTVILMKMIKEKYLMYEGYDDEFYREIMKQTDVK